MDLGAQAAGIGALADGTRRALYQYVVAQPEPVGREQAARAVGVPVHKASFHLDRLVGEGLLETEYRRLGGRRGPGAGRPSKLYRRGDREFAVTLPARRYDLVGDILAAAVTRAAAGTDLDTALTETARVEGAGLGAAARGRAAEDLNGLAEVLATQGYEPRVGAGDVVLANCPFDTLADKHTDLVCGLNQHFVQGVADGMGCHRARARLEPAPDRCCVVVRED